MKSRFWYRPTTIGAGMGLITLPVCYLVFRFIMHRESLFVPVLVSYIVPFIILTHNVRRGNIRSAGSAVKTSVAGGLTFILTDWAALQVLPPEGPMRDLWDILAPYYAAFKLGLIFIIVFSTVGLLLVMFNPTEE